jgi:hypothetical protein
MIYDVLKAEPDCNQKPNSSTMGILFVLDQGLCSGVICSFLLETSLHCQEFKGIVGICNNTGL